MRFVLLTTVSVFAVACSAIPQTQVMQPKVAVSNLSDSQSLTADTPPAPTAEILHETRLIGENAIPASHMDKAPKEDDEPRPYDETRDANTDVDATLFAARETGKNALIVMGANWCHDSRALAGQFIKPKFQALLVPNYELVYVDVGQKDRNIDIAKRFGLDSIVGTPTVFIVSPKGEVLNLDTAPTWRHAASKTENDIHTYFKDFADRNRAQH